MGIIALHFNPAVIEWENIIFNISCLPKKRSFALAFKWCIVFAHDNLTQCLAIHNETSSYPGEISQLAGGRSAGYLQEWPGVELSATGLPSLQSMVEFNEISCMQKHFTGVLRGQYEV